MEEGELFLDREEYADYDEMEEGQITAYPDELDHQRELQMLSEQLFKGNCKEITLKNITGIDIPIKFNRDEFVQEIIGNTQTDSAIDKLAKRHPEYNYVKIKITVKDGIIVNNMTSEYFTIVNRTKNQYMLINVIIKYKNTYPVKKIGYHANSVFVDLINLSAEYFEPQHSNDANMGVQLQVSRILRKYISDDIRMTITSQSCPNLGPQSITQDKFCQTWSLMFLYYKVNLPEISIYEIYRYFSSMNHDSLKSHIDKFINCFVWIINDKLRMVVSVSRTIYLDMTRTIVYIFKNKEDLIQFKDIDLDEYIKCWEIATKIYDKINSIQYNIEIDKYDDLQLFNIAKDLIIKIMEHAYEFDMLQYIIILDEMGGLDQYIEGLNNNS